MGTLRQAIGAVIVNEKGQVLLCQRSDLPDWWQFPQGGIEPGETAEMALFRELSEELGNNKVEVLKAANKTSVYYWPRETARKHIGQEMHWFLVRFQDGEVPHLEKSDRSFLSTKWDSAENALKQIAAFKRASFTEGLRSLGLIP